jgi:hypothetical protein
MLAPFTKSPERLQAAERVKQWTRVRFGLARDAAVSVSQIACAVPGCPPVETRIMFWSAEQKWHYFKVFKPLQEVVEEDLPPGWYRDALAVQERFECDCC